MKILVAHCLPAQRNGGATRLMGFMHDQLHGNGHDVTYLTSEDVPGWVPRRLRRWVFPLLVYAAARKAARGGHPFDVVNVHEPHSAVIARLRAGAGHPAVVVMSHGLEARGWEVARRHVGMAGQGPSLRERITYPLLDLPQSRAGLRHADHVVCLNLESRTFLQERMAFDPSRITVITPGADPCFAAASSNRTCRPVRRLLFAGTWIPRKGIADLVVALSRLASAGRCFELVVLGGGLGQDAVRAAFPPSLRSRVMCVTASDDEAAARVFAGADAYVLPSLFEGTPLTLIEAMWSGLPIVTTATSGMNDVIEDGVTGLLVAPASPDEVAAALARLQDEPGHAFRMGSAARDHAQASFTWNAAAESVARAYKAAVDRSKTTMHAPPGAGAADLQADYDRWHGQYASASALDTPWHALLRRHLDPARDLAGRITLEVACGRGDLAAWCVQACSPPPRLLAGDFSKEAARITASRLCEEGLSGQAMQMDAQRLPLRDGSVDTVISCETLEHLPNPKAALAEFARVLSPGGRLFLTTPNYLGPTGAYRIYLRLVGRRYSEDGQPVNRFLVAPLTRRWVRDAGLIVRRTDGQGHYVFWPGRNPIKLSLAPRVLTPFALHSLVEAQKPEASSP